MTRPRNTIPQYVSLDIQELDSIQSQFATDAEFGVWMRKAVRDMRSGCKSPDVDPFIKRQYDTAFGRMTQRQAINANAYKAAKNSSLNRSTRFNPTTRTTAAGAVNGNATEELSTSDNNASATGTTTPAAVVLSFNGKQAYGENKKVMLTTEEGAKLREVYGENLELAIDILDTYIVNNAKKAAKYKSHYAVLKKSGWVWDKVQEKLKATAQLVKAQTQPKSFDAMERERGSSLALAAMQATGGF